MVYLVSLLSSGATEVESNLMRTCSFRIFVSNGLLSAYVESNFQMQFKEHMNLCNKQVRFVSSIQW